jgi:hypothetical protein
MKKEENVGCGFILLGSVIVALLFTVILVYSVVVGGYVLSILWGWFITPVFNIAAPGVLACSGIIMFVGYLTGRNVKTSSKDENHNGLALIFLAPWLTLFFGWILHSFM